MARLTNRASNARQCRSRVHLCGALCLVPLLPLPSAGARYSSCIYFPVSLCAGPVKIWSINYHPDVVDEIRSYIGAASSQF